MFHKLSVCKKFIDRPQKPTKPEAYQIINSMVITEDLTIENIAELCRRNAQICNPFYQKPVKGEKTAKHDCNFVEYGMFQLDIDDGMFDMEGLEQDPTIQKYGGIILTSFRNTSDEPRGKVLFFLKVPIKDIAKAKEFAQAMLWHFRQYNPDTSVGGVLSLCYTSHPTTGKVEIIGNLVDEEFVDEVISQHKQHSTSNRSRSSTKTKMERPDDDDEEQPEDAYTDFEHSPAFKWFHERVDYSTFPEKFGYIPNGKDRWDRPSTNGEAVSPGSIRLGENQRGYFYHAFSGNDPVAKFLASVGKPDPQTYDAFHMFAVMKCRGTVPDNELLSSVATFILDRYRIHELNSPEAQKQREAFAQFFAEHQKRARDAGNSTSGFTSSQQDDKQAKAEAKEARKNPGVYIENRLKTLIDEDLEKSVHELLRWNEEEQRIYVGDNPLEDHTSNLIYASFIRAPYRPAYKDIDIVMEEIANRKSFSPIRDYLSQSRWDGTPRIREFAQKYIVDDDKIIHYEDGHSELARVVFFGKWMVGAVAKVRTQGKWQNPVLVWLGDQGKGKSTLAAHLCSGLGEKYFAELTIDTNCKDHQIMTATHFIIELKELGATTKRQDTEALKGFLTTKKFPLRPAYARHASDFYNIASFIGTVNRHGAFLNDPTGNRRFLILNIKRIDRGYEQEDVNQLWAEAVHLYDNGYECGLTPEEIEVRDGVNELHNTHLLMEDYIQDFCTIDPESDAFTPSRVLVEAFLELKMCRGKSPDFVSKDISTALNKLGVEPERKRIFDRDSYKQVRGYRGVAFDEKAFEAYLEEEHEKQQERYRVKGAEI